MEQKSVIFSSCFWFIKSRFSIKMLPQACAQFTFLWEILPWACSIDRWMRCNYCVKELISCVILRGFFIDYSQEIYEIQCCYCSNIQLTYCPFIILWLRGCELNMGGGGKQLHSPLSDAFGPRVCCSASQADHECSINRSQQFLGKMTSGPSRICSLGLVRF